MSETDPPAPPWWIQLLWSLSWGWPHVLLIAAIAIPAAYIESSSLGGALTGLGVASLLAYVVFPRLSARSGWRWGPALPWLRSRHRDDTRDKRQSPRKL